MLLFSNFIPSAIVSNSQHAIKAHIEAGYNASRFIHIPHGYQSEKYHSVNLKYRMRQKLNLHPEKILLGMVARYDPYKDHETLLVAYSELIKSIQNTSLVLIGPRMDQSNKELEQLINRHNLGQHVYLLGPNDDIPSIMSCLDIHVLSSVDESFPNVVAEAMAVGTPCVTTDVGDAAYIVGNAGWVVPPSCPKGLKNGMVEAITLMQSRSSWIDLKTACRTRVNSEFSNEKMVGAYLKLWRQAVRG